MSRSAKQPVISPAPPLTATGEYRLHELVGRTVAPLDKAAFGAALGIVAALPVALATALDLLLDPHQRAGLALLAQFFHGYTVSPAGIAVGAAWAFVVGFVAGWFIAFVRNLVIGVWLLYVRARADWRSTADLLDHL